jgi:hypothetical protein
MFHTVPYSHRRNNRTDDMASDIKGGIPPAIRPLEHSPACVALWDILESCWGFSPDTRPNAAWVLRSLENLSDVSQESHTHLSQIDPKSSIQIESEDSLRSPVSTSVQDVDYMATYLRSGANSTSSSSFPASKSSISEG